MFQRYGLIEGRDIGEMVDFAAGLHRLGLAAARGTARRHLHGVGRRRRLDGGRLHAAGLEVPEIDKETRAGSTCICPPTAPRRTRSTPPPRPSPRSATRACRSWCCPRPSRRHRRGHDGRAIRTATGTPEGGAGATRRRRREKPILMWSYTLPAQRSVEMLSEAGLPLYTDIGTARARMRAMADYRALRERFLRPDRGDDARITAGQGLGAAAACRGRARAQRVGGAADPGGLRHRGGRGRHAGDLGRGGRGRGEGHRRRRGAEGAVAGHPAQDGGRRGGAEPRSRRRRARRLRARARQRAPRTRPTRASSACWCSRWRRRAAR